MELFERDTYLDLLRAKFRDMARGRGHCVIVGGEAGIGKTSLVRAFCEEKESECSVFIGNCDALFTPRPLAPLYDIAWQMQSKSLMNQDFSDRAGLFAKFFQELSAQSKPCLIVFEDIHWADEATLDFIRFFIRRVSAIHCIFILTFRDNELHPGHPLLTVLGQLPFESISRIQLEPLSSETVNKMALEKGYRGEDVFGISGGNPFYVTEILASYNEGISENIKESILSVYHGARAETKEVWNLLSVFPNGTAIDYLEKVAPSFSLAVADCIDKKIVVPDKGRIFFKHELFRRTIESSLSPLVRVALNKKIIEKLLDSFEERGEIERIVHHAKNANDYDAVVKYAPLAAKQAASMGAHVEASRLFQSAIEYYQGKESSVLVEFYERYAYECYLTNHLKDAIIYQSRALKLLKEGNDPEKTANCLRWLSRFWWYDGDSKRAELYGKEAVELLEHRPVSKAKGMAFSNMSQLKMLSDETEECIYWGEKAIAIAKELQDDETLSHALNNVGSVKASSDSSMSEGIAILEQSLGITLAKSYHEHAARAYTNLASKGVQMRSYELAKKYLDAGIAYCEERDLNSWATYMLSFKSRLCMEMGNWEEGLQIALQLLNNPDQAKIIRIVALIVAGTIKARRMEDDALGFLQEAKLAAFDTGEPQRIIPAFAALLEYEWISGSKVIEDELLSKAEKMAMMKGNIYENSEFAFRFQKARHGTLQLVDAFQGYRLNDELPVREAVHLWEQMGCPYEKALILFGGDESDKKEAITILQQLGALAVVERLKQEMRKMGIKSIPRGSRKSTLANAASLTSRELDVLQLLKDGLQNKEIASKLFISAKTVDHHISSLLFKLDVNSRTKAVHEAAKMGILK